MALTVLARKWRPKQFSHLVGQQTAVTVLNNILRNNRLHHAYLLTGTRGVGKTTIARIIAKALNCNNIENIEPCGNCQNCSDIDSGRFVDVIEIDAASNTGVDNIRELIDNAQYVPTIGKYKVYIIDEVHMLSKSAFNAMLKTLEEPPTHAIFVLATTDVQKIPVTILSRCLQLKLRNLAAPEIAKHLAHVLNAENISYENEALNIIAQVAHGSMRDALSITDQAIAYTNHKINLVDIKNMLGITDDVYIYHLLDAINTKHSNNLIKTAEDIYSQGYDLESVLLKLNQVLCDISLLQLGNINNNDNLEKYAKSISINDIQLYFEITNLGLEQIVKSSNKYQIFVMTLLRMIAFTIGNSSNKQQLVNNSNFNIIHSDQAAIPETHAITVEENNNLNHTIAPIHTKDTALENTPSDVEPADKNFDGNWLELIERLEQKLDKAVHPILINAKFNSFSDNQFDLTIDHKYQIVVGPEIINRVNQIFSEYFGKNITFNLQFSDNVNETLKEKRQITQDTKQKQAEEIIQNDPNLNKIKQLFSATIVPNSIKPV